MDKDVALGILQAAIALAGLLLVFIGFLQTKADQTALADDRNRVRLLARVGLIPFFGALICTWQSIWAIQGAVVSGEYLYLTLKIVLVLTGLYAIMATFYEAQGRRR